MPSHNELIHLVGDVEAMTISAILDTGASLAEVEQAARWAAGEAVTRQERHELSRRAEAVYDILIDDPTFAAANDLETR